MLGRRQEVMGHPASAACAQVNVLAPERDKDPVTCLRKNVAAVDEGESTRPALYVNTDGATLDEISALDAVTMLEDGGTDRAAHRLSRDGAHPYRKSLLEGTGCTAGASRAAEPARSVRRRRGGGKGVARKHQMQHTRP